MDAGGKFFLRKEQWQHSGEGDAGILHSDDCLRLGGEFLGGKDGARWALLGQAEVFFVLGEGEVARLGRVGLGEAGKLDAAVANDFSPDLFGDLASGEFHMASDVALLDDGIAFAEDDDARLVVRRRFLVEQAKEHDG